MITANIASRNFMLRAKDPRWGQRSLKKTNMGRVRPHKFARYQKLYFIWESDVHEILYTTKYSDLLKKYMRRYSFW